MKSVSIFGVHVAAGLSRQGLLDCVAGWVSEGQPRTIAYVNAHCLNLAYQDQEYHRILNSADLVYPDGIGAVWAGKILGGHSMTRLTGADWIGDFCACAVEHEWRVFLLGGEEGVAQRAAERLQVQHPGLQVVGAIPGFFDNIAENQIIENINQSEAQVVLVGMGSPRQEKWLNSWRTHIKAPVCWAVGALFDYLAGRERRSPVWLNRLGGEWLWRLAMDPRRKWRRYLWGNPLFVGRVLREKWKGEI